ncbi:hypothetical protein EGW08_004707 [Elysia chlorotica]|uniref:CARD domain-containing protein n=1 Tax=Elysia chlorotica TaxID=188477 RepID=A0A3S1BN66_ELYCH|nr:hypothetical protein EGW08_004707 [Elysia chlorotica]
MNVQDWQRLQKNWTSLRDVHPDDVIPYLYQEGILELEPSKKKFDNIYQLLDILQKNKSSDCFQCFLDALRKTGYEFLADKIESTEVFADSTLKPRSDPSLLEPKAREILIRKFVEKKDAEVFLHEVRQELENNEVFIEITWTNDKLKDFMAKVFNGIEITPPIRRRHGNKRTKLILVKNLCKYSNTDDGEGDTMPSIQEQVNKGFQGNQQVKDLSPLELKEFLSSRMESEGLPIKYLDIMEQAHISGKIFLTLEEKDFEKILSKSDPSFGVIRFLSMLVKELLEQPVLLDSKETLRSFDSPVTHFTVYKKGRCCDTSNFIKDKTTRPIKMFLTVDESPQHKIPEFIASEVIPFASACLNQRRNGIIYFGIHGRATGSHQCGEIVGIPLDQSEALPSVQEGSKTEKGKVVSLTQQDIQCELNHYLEKAFIQGHQEIIKNTVRDAKFIPVIIIDEPRSKLWVVEVDVNASSELLKDEIIPTVLKLLPIHGRKNKIKDGVFTFSSDGIPKLLDSAQRHNFEKNHKRILNQRKQDEQKEQDQFHPNLRTKLLNLLTGGNEVIRDMMFFFLVLSPITEHSLQEGADSRKSLSTENLQFVKYLAPEIVFDFDSRGSEKGIYKVLEASEVMRVLTTDNFDESKRTLEEMKEQGDSLAIENKISWFFCNGYAPTEVLPLSSVEWNKKRKTCFQECLRLFINTFGKERVTVLICLMSKDCDIMTDASGEILSKLSDNWMVLAESEEVAHNWQQQVLLRNWVDKQDLYDRCVIGMPWDHVNITIQQAKRPMPSDICYLPTSTGALIEVKEKKIKDWCHIDVLSADFKPSDESDEYSRKIEEQFYRGEQAQWSNFYFKPQVLVRDKHKLLMTHVEKALKSPGKGKRNKVAIVELHHQPMAGGTTSAKQVLWDLRQQYRCCVVKTIKEQTAQQLNELHKYDERNPKPLLILIDNEDEDKLAKLLEELEDRGQRRSFDVDEMYEVYCVAIICRRRTSFARNTKGVHFEQELSKNELQWFTEKDKYLSQRFKKDEVSFMDPKFLIAFNIMKQRFDPKYIETTLSMFTDSVVEEIEVKLLKMVCFLNLYDPSFTKISVSCLDDLLLDRKGSWGTRKKMLVRNQKWEACLSPAVKVLLNLSSDSLRTAKNRSTVCTFNKVIAEGVLKRIVMRTHQKVSEIMLELLDSSMFVEQKHDTASLINIINNIVKTRVVIGGIKQKFSQFLLDVKKKEGPKIAVNVLEQVFEINNDPFTAQLIARFYMIELKNWEDAEIYARRATSKMPTNSYLWDTSAQVYQCQLQDELSDASKTVTKKVIQHWISLSIKSLDMFKKEEEVNDAKCEEHEPLLACYFGELRAIELILQGISKNVSFSSPLSLHQFLVDPEFLPEELTFLTEEERRHFKSLKAISEEAFTRLNDENIQMKTTFDFALDGQESYYDYESIGKLSLTLENYFGLNEIPLRMPEKEFYNFTQAKKLGGTHLRELLNLRDCSVGKLQKIYQLMTLNVKSESVHRFKYLLTAIGSCTVLMLLNRCPSDLDFNTLLSWCDNLIELNKRRPRGRCFLEPYLYYIMYNFPTEERSKYKICSSDELASVIKSGTAAFMVNNPSYAGRRLRKRRVTTLFFLGAKGPLQDIVHMDILREGMNGQSIEDKWLRPELKETLRQLEGILLEGGEKVRFSRFEIQTSHPIEDTAIWQKRVNFYVGFSWASPLAYGIKPLDLD